MDIGPVRNVIQVTYIVCLLLLSIDGPPSAFSSPLEQVEKISSSTVKRSDFPANFLFGASSSALQTEGTAGRGASTWDIFVEGGTAVDSYHLYKEDVAMLKNMSASSYRFSICWARILPNGTLSGVINQDGIDFYSNLINELLAANIRPLVTLFHFDLPQDLQDAYNGLLSKQIVADFAAYADLCFKMFGDRIKRWATFNEPHVFGAYGYPVGGSFVNDPTRMPYIATHNTILAHAAAVKLYRQKYLVSQGGEIGISLMIQWFLPFSQSRADRAAVDRAWAFMVGWYMEPLVHGDYPSIMKDIVKERLPVFTRDEKKMVKGSLDFVTVNYYTARYVKAKPFTANEVPVGYDEDVHTEYSVTNGRRVDPSEMKMMKPKHPKIHTGSDVTVYPAGLRNLLIRVKNIYQNPEIYITENGTGETRNDTIPLATALEDPDRIDFVTDHLKAVKEALRKGVKVKGYFNWSLTDGMEPAQGYTFRMGLIFIDYFNNFKRIPKKSAAWYRDFITGV